MMDGSLERVEHLKVGDQLMGIGGDPQTIEEIQSARGPVVKTVVLVDGDTLTARTSPTHAFALPYGGFVVAVKAKGVKVRVWYGGAAEIGSVTPDGIDTVYNVITDGSHTYCADGVWALGVGDAERRVDMETWTRLGAQMEVQR